MIKLKEISKFIQGKLMGDPELEILSVNSLEKANTQEITFSVKENIDIKGLHAGALVVKHGSAINYQNLIYVDEPYVAFAKLLEFFFPHVKFNTGIDENAFITPGVNMGLDISVGAFSYIGKGCDIGEKTEIHSGVVIYDNVKIGKHCLIYSNVVIRENITVGDYVIIQPGAVIGGDGFGFTRTKDGTLMKIPQKGKVVIGNNCEIGTNTCIDRATIGETVIKDFVKLDNLVQISHNVSLGKKTTISSQTGVSGSVDVGENVIMAGQVGIVDHVSIGDNVIIAAKCGVSKSIEEKSIIAGVPHQDIRDWRKSIAIIRNLEKYIDRIKSLEHKIKELEEK